MAGTYAAKALEQLLCERCNDSANVHVFIHIIKKPYRPKSCIQEVLLHMCLPFFYPSAFFWLRKGLAIEVDL